MLVSMSVLLEEARKKSYAVGAFNAPGLEAVKAVVAAAEELGCPVILQHAEVHDNLISMEEIAPIMLYYAKKSSVPVGVHFDHGSSFESCLKAMKLGFTSVMYDASAKSFDDNARETAEIVKIAHAFDVAVEAELGHVFTSAVGGGGKDAEPWAPRITPVWRTATPTPTTPKSSWTKPGSTPWPSALARHTGFT